MDLADWFRVDLNDEEVVLDVSPPEETAWKQSFPWSSIERVCFKSEGLWASDGLYIFTSLRPESFVVPVEASGGNTLLEELTRRGLFPAEISIKAVQAREGEILCWPPPKE